MQISVAKSFYQCAVENCRALHYRNGLCKAHLSEKTARDEADEYKRLHIEDSIPPCVYAIKGGDMVKFGLSKNPEVRLKNLQTGSPQILTLLGAIGGSEIIEMAIHRILCDYHSHGEWFRYEGEAIRIADAIASGSFDELEAALS